MADTDFEANNRAYLQAGLRWLRALLRARAAQIAPSSPPLDTQAAKSPSEPAPRWPFGKRAPQKETLALPAPLESEEIKTARAAMDEAARGDPAPALIMLSRRLSLSSFEEQMLLFCAAFELDPDMPALAAAACGDPGKRVPTFALGMALFGDATWDALAPGRPLRGLQLLEVHQAGSMALIAAPLRIDERIAAFVKGLNYLDERIAALASVALASDAVPDSHHATIDTLARWMSADAPAGVLQIVGGDSSSKRDVVAAASAKAGRVLLAAPSSSLPARADDIDHVIRLWTRESALLPVALFIERIEADRIALGEREPGTERARSWQWLQRLPGPVFVDSDNPLSELAGCGVVRIDPPRAEERKKLWSDALAAHGFDRLDDAGLSRLAHEFRLSASRIAQTATSALPLPAAAPQDGIAFAWHACVANAASAIDGLAQRIEPRATLDDVKLSTRDKQQLERLVEHARHRGIVLSDYGYADHVSRGLGLAALFHGESGTGKTMAAEAVANALGLALFRVDLSSVVSKYIGETSKNLRRVFDAAEGGGAVLLFDEADAVFSRRSEVKDSHDRYANIDVNYLLTRMESFGGVTILATNMKHALDPAFLRRLRFIVGFAFPGVAERKAIWESVWPADAPRETLDVDRLVRFALPGGSIFNAALAAAHSAAAAGRPIAMPDVLDAIRWELVKLEIPAPEAELRWSAPPTKKEAA
jgi:hypothetical protein